MHKKIIKQSGFHLMEILITITLVGILFSFAVPSFTHYLVRSHRLEAENMLLKLAIAMDHYHFEHNDYDNVTLEALHFPEFVAAKSYQLRIHSDENTDYILSAIPLEKQVSRDRLCGTLMLNSLGEKKISGDGEIFDCWY